MAIPPHVGERSTALITGASAGIGAAFAKQFARNGFDLVLVARREERLRELGKELGRAYGASVHLLPADLAKPETPDKIFSELTERGIQVGVLVNNAGYGIPGNLEDSEWSRHEDYIQVMVTAPVHLAYLAAAEMIKRKKGFIINVGSLSGFLPPHAGGTLYYPAKSFIIKFSLAHGAELRRKGIFVTALCPGFTHTEFQKAAGGTVEAVKMPDFGWMTADEVARLGFSAVMRGDPVCVPGLFNRLIVRFFKYIPDSFGRWIIGRTGSDED